jgi:hypothetical protein
MGIPAISRNVIPDGRTPLGIEAYTDAGFPVALRAPGMTVSN